MTTHAHHRGARAAHPPQRRAADDPTAPKKRRRVRMFPILAAVIVGLGIAGSVGPFLDYRRVEVERKAMEAEVALLEQENQAVQRQIDQLAYDSYLESLARQELGLALPGEDVFIVPVPDAAVPDDPPAEPEENVGPLERALQFLLDVF